MTLDKAVAVVTGGGTGIGHAIALDLARAGAAAVVVNYAHSIADAERTAADVRKLGCDALAARADVADDGQVQAMAERVLAQYGRVDLLVNNAGTTQPVAHTDLDGLTGGIWRHLFAVNVVGPFQCARAFAPALRATGGAIVNVASISGYRAGGSSIAYGVSKAALLQLTRNLAVALAPQVRVNAVAPGTVATAWQTRLHGEEGFARFAQGERDRIPLARVAEPEHVAQAVRGLLEMELVTGEAIIVDGGKHVVY